MIKFRRRHITTTVMTIQRPNMLKKSDMIFDLPQELRREKADFSGRYLFAFTFSISFFLFTKLSMMTYDVHTRYYGFTLYPKQMKLFEEGRGYLKRKYTRLMKILPFEGEIPEVDKPENYEKAKGELKEYFFGTKAKEAERKVLETQLNIEGKAIDEVLNKFSDFVDLQDEKLKILIKDQGQKGSTTN